MSGLKRKASERNMMRSGRKWISSVQVRRRIVCGICRRKNADRSARYTARDHERQSFGSVFCLRRALLHKFLFYAGYAAELRGIYKEAMRGIQKIFRFLAGNGKIFPISSCDKYADCCIITACSPGDSRDRYANVYISEERRL